MATAKKTSSSTKSRSGGKSRSSGSSSTRGSTSKRSTTGVADVGRKAAEQLAGLAGREVEGITGIERSDDGWTVQVEVVEARRIPDSVDVMALYEVQVDGSGEVQGYRRTRRYLRGRTIEET